MPQLQTFHLSHLPPSTPIHVALYRNLENASFLREQLLSGNSEFEYAFIDASMILSTTHALSAAFRAINDYTSGRLKSRNVHSEIVFSLSPNNNIAESFRRFGVTDATKDLLVIKVSTSPEITHDSVAKHLETSIKGTPAPFDDGTLSSISDVAKIKKAYKLTSVGAKPGKGANNEASNALDGQSLDKTLERSIIGSIALRGAA
ncbi:hypothetical protein FQN54_004991 [Arachnomyces sp. PD_36]|nr:hypothetical protein FQN54_004991 [Arachnomyces sp. PD_36]